MTTTTPYEIAQERAHLRLVKQREVIAEALAKGFSADIVSREVHTLAVIEGSNAVDLAKAMDDQDAAQKIVIGMLLRGPDDTWSGRGNDLARSRFDGITGAARGFVKDY